MTTEPTQVLRFIAKFGDTSFAKIDLSKILLATANLMDDLIESPAGSPLGTRQCKACQKRWDSLENKVEMEVSGTKSLHYQGCALFQLEKTITDLLNGDPK